MSILTKEVIQKILNDDWLLMDDCEGLENCTVIKELARMALAAMDSEPVAEVIQKLNGYDRPLYVVAIEGDVEEGDVLYRHAQQPVVPDEHSYTEPQKRLLLEAANVLVTRKPTVTQGYLIREVGRIAIRALGRPQPSPVVEREPIAWLNDAYLARGVVDGEAGSEDAGPGYIPVYREAGSQTAPVVPDDVLDALQKVARIRLDLNDFDGDRRGIADCLCDAEEALIELVNRRAAMLNGGNDE